ADTGTINFSGGFTQGAGGTLNLNGGNIASPSAIEIDGGLVEGSGTIGATVNQTGGTFAPGHSPGIIHITGDWNLTAGDTVDIQVQGTDPNVPDFDQVIVSGTANLAGTLNITEIGGFTAGPEQFFTILQFAAHTGDFGTYNGLTPGSGYW